jgi:hypothetical protein
MNNLTTKNWIHLGILPTQLQTKFKTMNIAWDKNDSKKLAVMRIQKLLIQRAQTLWHNRCKLMCDNEKQQREIRQQKLQAERLKAEAHAKEKKLKKQRKKQKREQRKKLKKLKKLLKEQHQKDTEQLASPPTTPRTNTPERESGDDTEQQNEYTEPIHAPDAAPSHAGKQNGASLNKKPTKKRNEIDDIEDLSSNTTGNPPTGSLVHNNQPP